ncbi:hypothetical protein [Bradyrhizobium sp. JYMT SZCCT0428]|uniref:hypothetical protein n=1 Tax=Bradyrhizobium sp. JYMT SZCCT0428 TaxID=2807673 RepID=UPI001BA616BA|nr:hypothetical protein [Bradyrhizobium sp. JYMT SZCCT0428]MBR1150071.1 hypothetical protein [Bradyrhizobium sp. JYMT SZCCT0428]
MADLNALIRPFQAVDVSYPRRIVKSDAVAPDNVVLKVGDGGGGIKTLSYSYSYSMTGYMEKKAKEVEVEPEAAPDGRERHVKRIPGKRKKSDGSVEKVPGTYIDVERIDSMTTEEGSGPDYQKTKTKLKWYLDDNGNDPNPSRKRSTIEVTFPENPDVFFELDVNDAISVRDDDQVIRRRFDNSADNSRRRHSGAVRRVKHYDTPYDDDPNYEDGGIIRGYQKTPGTKDDDQYLDVEIPGEFGFDDYRLQKSAQPNYFEHWQRTSTRLNNGYLIDQTDLPDKGYGDSEINPPYRLDPFQNIVNVKLGLDVIVVLLKREATQVGATAVGISVIDDAAEFLRSWSTPYATGPGGFPTFAYKVSASAGQFIRTTASQGSVIAMAFAIMPGQDGLEKSLSRAEQGARRVLPATFLFGSTSDPGLPADIAPPGLLWVVETLSAAVISVVWKIRYGKHRDDQNSTPSDVMVQCYPLSGPGLGYEIYAYRLDRLGTGTVYSKRADAENDQAQNLPSAWNQIINPVGGSGAKGIRYSDPPPLIGVDLV